MSGRAAVTPYGEFKNERIKNQDMSVLRGIMGKADTCGV